MKRLIPFICPVLCCVQIASAAVTAPADVPADHPYSDAVTFVTGRSLMTTDSSNVFHVDRVLTRAEVLKVLIEGWGDSAMLHRCAARTAKGAWYAPYLCTAQGTHMIADATRAQPARAITFAELSKWVSEVFALDTQPLHKGDAWYVPYVTAVANMHAVPESLESAEQHVTRGEMAEVVYRLSQKITDHPSTDADTLLSKSCHALVTQDIPGVDLAEVRRVWEAWINDARKKESPTLKPYHEDLQLDRSAQTWSDQAEAKGAISHKRLGQKLYYDYHLIEQWFASLGLTFANVKSTTFTENIGYGPYSCSVKDCTQKLIEALRSTFDMYMAEKGKASRAHWNSIMDPYFTLVGTGIAVDEKKKTYYITTHYATKITSDPPLVCL